MESTPLVIRPRDVARANLVAFALLFVGNALAVFFKRGLGREYAWGYVELFHFDAECNVPTFFSAVLILQAAILCRFIFAATAGSRWPWMLLSGVFLFLAFDESCQLHERLIRPVRGALSTSGFFYFAWVIPYGLIVAVLGLSLLSWLRRLPSSTRNGFLLAGAIFLGGAVVTEGITGMHYEEHGVDLGYDLLSGVEETLEMLGMIYFLYVASRHLAEHGTTRMVEARPS